MTPRETKWDDPLQEMISKAVHAAYEDAARIAEQPYSDEVQCFGYDEPSAVGKKIAAAIRERLKP